MRVHSFSTAITFALMLLYGCGSPGTSAAPIQSINQFVPPPSASGRSSQVSIITGWRTCSLSTYAEGADVALGPDGDLYTQGAFDASIVKVDTSCNETTIDQPGDVDDLYNDAAMTSNADGNVYAMEDIDSTSFVVVQITPSGHVTSFPLPFRYPADQTLGIVTGSDNNLWILHKNGVGRMTTSGEYTEFGGGPWGDYARIVPGPDKNLWVDSADDTHSVLVRVNVQDGSQTTFSMPADAYDLTIGPNGQMYCMGTKKVYALDTLGDVVTYPIGHEVRHSGANPFVMVAGPKGSGRLFWEEGIRSQDLFKVFSFNVRTHLIENRLDAPNPIGTPTVGSDNNLWFFDRGLGSMSILLFD